MKPTTTIAPTPTYTHTCVRCGGTWQSTVEEPVLCNRCKQRNWWKPARDPHAPRPKRKVGEP